MAKISRHLVLSCVVTCFGSSLLYGYGISVFNGPKAHIECFLAESLLGVVPCPRDASRAANASNATGWSSGGTAAPNDSAAGGQGGNASSVRALHGDVGHRVGFLYSLLVTVWIAFGALGAFCTGAISNYLGRRTGLLINCAFAVAGSAAGAPAVATGQPYLLYIGRALIGFNCGVTVGLASIYLTEIAPMRHRGAIGACHQLAVTLGILLAFIISGLEQTLNRPHLWIAAHALTGLPVLLSMALLPFCPESPRFLYINRKDRKAAVAALLKLYPDESPEAHIQEMDNEMAPALRSDPGAKFRFCQLFTLAELRVPVALAVCVQIMQQLSGINAVMSFSTAMMNACGIPQSAVPYLNLGFSLLNVLCTVVSLPLLEKLGRRSLLLWPTALLAVSLVVLCVSAVLVRQSGTSPEVRQAASVAFIVFIFVYISSFAVGLGTIPGFIVAELFRQEPRSAAYSLSQGVQWVTNLLVSTTFVNLQLAMDGYVFLVYLAVVAPLWVFFYACMPETKGRSFDAIANDLAFAGCRRRRGRSTHSQLILDESSSPLAGIESSAGKSSTEAACRVTWN